MVDQQENHNIITLHRYFNDEAITLDGSQIKSMNRYSETVDALWDHADPKPYTMVVMNADSLTSEGVTIAYVRETPDEIRKLTL